MATGKKLSELTTQVSKLNGTERIYVSDGTGVPKYIEASQLTAGKYLDLSIFSQNTGILSTEDYQKIVDAYTGKVNKGYLDTGSGSMSVVPLTIVDDTTGGTYVIACQAVVYAGLINKYQNIIYNFPVVKSTREYAKIQKSYTMDFSGDGTKAFTDNGEYVALKTINGISILGEGDISFEDMVSYGIEYDITVSSPECLRIGNPAHHRALPIHSKIRGCLLNDEGEVVKYLDPSSWLDEVRDGSQGQVMVELPMYYRKFETDGNKRRVKLSEYPLPGYHQVKRKYVSAYEATVQRSITTLCSVVNTDADFRGGNNNAEWDGTYRSLLGMPATSISRVNFRAYARKRKSSTKEWNCMTYDIHKDLYWLFIIEYATLNSQKAFDASKDSNGYAQGGLGNGVTNIDSTKWSAFNNSYPFIPCGYTDGLGNGTGEVEFSMPEEYDSAGLTVKVARYRGIENPFGHIWKWTDGINVRISPDSPEGDGLNKVFVTDNPEHFNDSGYEGMSYAGDEARTNGYVKSVIFGEGGEIIPDVVGGGSTTYFCDYHYTNIPASETLRGVLFGGTALNGATAGFCFANSLYSPSLTGTTFGSRLCFIPA